MTVLPDGRRSVRVADGDNSSVQLEFEPRTGEATAYREYAPDGEVLTDRTLERIATVGNEGEIPPPAAQ